MYSNLQRSFKPAMTRLASVLVAVCLNAQAEDWPQFRGPLGTGVAAGDPIPVEWSEAERLSWKTAVPGAGWSQPVIVGPLVFVTSAVSDQLAPPKDYAGGTSDPYTISGDKASAPQVMITWKVFALDLRTGAIKWDRPAASGKPKYPVHPSNTYASETPAADSRAVYAFFGAVGTVVAFDHAGSPIWQHELGVFRLLNNTGTASSPRLYNDLLFVQCFNEEQTFLVALDTRDGHEKWRTTRQSPASSWNTPFVWRNKHRVELVICGKDLLSSHDPLTGTELWHLAGPDVPVIPSACGDSQRLYFGSRDPIKGGPLCAFPAQANDGPSPAHHNSITPPRAWAAEDAAPGMPSPLVLRDCVYVLHDTSLSCLDTTTGKLHFTKRLSGFRPVVASPVAAGDQVVVIDESGQCIVLRAGPGFEILGQSKLKDRFWASPSIAGGALILRGLGHVYCIRN